MRIAGLPASPGRAHKSSDRRSPWSETMRAPCTPPAVLGPRRNPAGHPPPVQPPRSVPFPLLFAASRANRLGRPRPRISPRAQAGEDEEEPPLAGTDQGCRRHRRTRCSLPPRRCPPAARGHLRAHVKSGAGAEGSAPPLGVHGVAGIDLAPGVTGFLTRWALEEAAQRAVLPGLVGRKLRRLHVVVVRRVTEGFRHRVGVGQMGQLAARGARGGGSQATDKRRGGGHGGARQEGPARGIRFALRFRHGSASPLEIRTPEYGRSDPRLTTFPHPGRGGLSLRELTGRRR